MLSSGDDLKKIQSALNKSKVSFGNILDCLLKTSRVEFCSVRTRSKLDELEIEANAYMNDTKLDHSHEHIRGVISLGKFVWNPAHKEWLFGAWGTVGGCPNSHDRGVE